MCIYICYIIIIIIIIFFISISRLGGWRSVEFKKKKYISAKDLEAYVC